LRILVTGRNGQVGWELTRTLAPLGDIVALDRSELDLAAPERIDPVLNRIRPDIIVNAAAHTAVDRAESEPDLARAVNATAPAILAEAAKRMDALLVHYSTDYVFDGTKDAPYVEDDVPNPLGVYGRSKLEGEQAIQASGCRYLILRTAWVYASRGKNFLLTIRKLARERPELRVVSDQFGAPTSAPAIAAATATLLQAVSRSAHEKYGVYHLTAAGRTSWHAFASLIAASAGTSAAVITPIPASEYPTPARRPMNSCLDNSKLSRTFGIRMASWQDEARRVLAELATN
jgi:dTDP-4-dehydrorhamnose reductase